MKTPLRYLIFLMMLFAACKQVYEPPVITAPNRFLVVEGVINTTPASRTTITLSRTRNLVDTVVTDPIKGAIVRIESKAGSTYLLAEQANGQYVSAQLSLNPNDSYRLRISTNGTEYNSEFVQAKTTPAIDSITWQQDKDVTIYANSHDALNNTRYYRWDFTETWQYRAVYETIWGVSGNLIFLRDPSQQVYNCWATAEANQIAIGTSIKLAQDVIDRAPVTVIPHPSEKIGVRYSILVRQYALTEAAYKYWEILQKNTEQLGTLFDAQPSQLKGNIRNEANAAEPVIGFVSASSITEKRMFIDNSQLVDWVSLSTGTGCDLKNTPQDPSNFLIYTYPDPNYAPYYFVTGAIILAPKTCLDCTLRGGTNQKPSFW
jgi:hypothetical protein